MIKTQKTKQNNKKGKLIPGNLIILKITAVSSNNIGINEFSYGIPVLVPNTKLGDIVQVKVLKNLATEWRTSKNIAIAKLVKIIKTQKVKQINAKLPALTAGTSLTITINKLGPNSTGIADVPNSYNNVNKIVVKKPFLKVGDIVPVEVTRIKKGYAFALINPQNHMDANPQISERSKMSSKIEAEQKQDINTFPFSTAKPFFCKGTKYSLVLPKKAKRYLKHIVFKLANTQTILFVKPCLGAKLGDKVQIQITKVIPDLNSVILISKIVKYNPISTIQKNTLVRTNLRQMLKSGMHYGEKAIKCNARMKNYVWTRKKTNKSSSAARTSLVPSLTSRETFEPALSLADAAQQQQFPLIKKGRNLINLLKTRRCLTKALAQLTKYAVKGKAFLFVGTKKAASGLVSRAALFTKKAFFVNTRWLGGMLTNWKTILKSILKIRPILKEKQIVIKDILEKRQNIKTRLIQKALLLRKKSKLMLKKGKQFLQMLQINQTSNTLQSERTSSETFQFIEKTNARSKMLNTKRKEFLSKGILLLEKQKQLSMKKRDVILQSLFLKSKAIGLTNTYRQLLNNLMLLRKKLRELKALLIISQELQVFKQQAKQDNTNLYLVSYNKYQSLLDQTMDAKNFVISNPPKEILNKMVSLIKTLKTNKNNNLKLKSVDHTKTLLLTQLLSKFNLFVPNIKQNIKNLQTSIKTQKSSLNKILLLLNNVKNQMGYYLTLKNKLMVESLKIKQTLQLERNIIRVLRRKLKQISAQKRLIKFLPKLRYLPTPAYKIEQTARFLMKRFVDPKMKYPMDLIYDEKLRRQTNRKKKWQRLEKYLGGISNMTKLKEKQIRNNVAIIIGQQEEMNAVRECKKLGIKMFHIVDTNCNPGFADHFIPANDDARNSIKFILGKFLTRIRLAQKLKMNFKKAGSKAFVRRKNIKNKKTTALQSSNMKK